ncbi:MAG: DegT/DnrJ/EryC1/StrS family aminotransferase [Clostridiales bacterium]
MKVAINDLKRQFDLHSKEYEKAALRVLRSGWYVLGEEVSLFEKEFASYIGGSYCVGLASGLDALWISFKLLGIGAGDEVIVASNSYIACVMGITMCGATPIFVEPNDFYNIDTSKIEEAITAKTKAILAVHLFGQSCNMDVIMDCAKRYKLNVIEDCAQSHGNSWKGKRVGTFGDIGCFSFYPTKGCGAFGDAGAIVTNNQNLADRFRAYRNYGSRVRYQNEIIGTNSRLDEMQAALLRVKLTYLEELNAERMKIAQYYNSHIENPLISLPKLCPGSDSTWHQYVIRCKQRDELMAYLKENGVDTLIHYPIPPHLSQAYAYLKYEKGAFPYAEAQANEVLSIPIFNGITHAELEHVVCQINQFRGKNGI